MLRYLHAYGPAASADVRAWCGLSGLPAAIKRLAPSLRTFRDERGRVLLDVPDGQLPDPDIPAPPRFLPAFDNAVLGYDDRSRIIDAEHRGLSVTGARFLLLDGRVAATWTVQTEPGVAVLRISALRGPPSDVVRAEVEAEGARLLEFLAPDAADRRVDWAAGRR